MDKPVAIVETVRNGGVEMDTAGTVVLTGAAGGMGKAVRSLLEERNWRVWALDISDAGGKDFIRTDITDERSVEAAFTEIRNRSGHIDAIVHTAGIYTMDSLVEMTEEEVLRIFNVNLFGIMRVNRIFLPILNPNSRITMVSSELAPLDPLPFTGIYAITKSAIEKYAYSLRMELQLLGHTVSVIRPGAVKTPFLGQSRKKIGEFCSKTELYRNTSRRFLDLVNRIETANVEPERIARKVLLALESRHPRYVYNINRSPLLRLMSALPQHLQTRLIASILRNR